VQSNPAVLNPQSIDLTGNVFGSQKLELISCVNGVGTGCGLDDAPGLAHSQVVSLGPVPSGNGLLFTATYAVVDGSPNAYSYVTIKKGTIDNPDGSQVIVSITNGVYGSPPANLPVARFILSSSQLFQGDTLTLDASSSYDPNPGHSIANYTWDILNTNNGQDNHQVKLIPILNVTFLTNSPNIGNYTATLVVTDDVGASTPQSHSFEVREHRIFDIAVAGITVSQYDNIIAGTKLVISVLVLNNGTVPITGFNLTLSANGKVIQTYNSTTTLARAHSTNSKEAVWDTSGLAPGVYKVVARIQPIIDPTTGLAEKNTANNLGHGFVRIISPYEGALIPFTMPELGGVIVAILVAVGIIRGGFSRLQVRRKFESEELR
jgi:hypothetical protein